MMTQAEDIADEETRWRGRTGEGAGERLKEKRGRSEEAGAGINYAIPVFSELCLHIDGCTQMSTW